jgi:hypothetical protein
VTRASEIRNPPEEGEESPGRRGPPSKPTEEADKKRSLSVILAAVVAGLGATGCATVTTDVARREGSDAAAGAAASLRVTVYDRRSDADNGLPAPHEVSSRLSRLEGKQLVTVHESTQSRWDLPELAPGKYVFAVTGWTDAAGKAHVEGTEEGFHVAPGENVKVEAILQDRRRNGVLTAVAVGGGALLGYVVYSVIHSLSNWKLYLSTTKSTR